MSAPASGSQELIETKAQLIESLEAGSKPKSGWKVGTEHEKFLFYKDTLKPLQFPDIAGILRGLTRLGWQAVKEGENIIALSRGRAMVSLEPGGQLELSGAPLANIHETKEEISLHFAEIRPLLEEIGADYALLGFAPGWHRDEMPWMPKARYKVMREYMPKKGNLGLDMMLRTCTVQANLDFGSEADMVAKFRLSLALQPVATALFANSRMVEGKDSGFYSYRSRIWQDTDPDRCGILPFVFDPGFGFERYVDYILDVPMYFVYRNGGYIDASGQSFRDFLKGRLPALPGELPTMGDWQDHLTTVFPEVRLKRYLEMRGADVGELPYLCALPAFWVGLLYEGLDAGLDLIKGLKTEKLLEMRAEVPRQGLKAVGDLATVAVEIAAFGLKARGLGEEEYLKVLFARLEPK